MRARANRNQHWVPQFYLRYFATPETAKTKSPKIWATPLDYGGKDFLTNPRNVAANRDLYELCGERVDEKLTDLEGMLGNFWPKLSGKSHPLDDGFKKALSLFIATLFLRHPNERERNRKAIRQRNGPTIEQFASFEELVGRQWGETILESTFPIASYLLTLPWIALATEEPAFFTSDHPVVIQHQHAPNPDIFDEGIQIYFPMTPTRLLMIGNHNWPDGELRMIPRGWEVFNHSIVMAAQRYVFSSFDPSQVIQQFHRFTDHLELEIERIDYAIVAARESLGIKIGRNDRCPCESGRKFKRCCGRRQLSVQADLHVN